MYFRVMIEACSV